MGCINSCEKDDISSVYRIKLDNLQEFVKNYENIKYTDSDHCILFDRAWHCEKFEIAKWLWDKRPIDLSKVTFWGIRAEVLFYSACRFGRLDMAKWLWETSLKNEYTIKINDLKYLKISCCYCVTDNIELVKWLLQLSKEMNSPIDIHSSSENVFRSCKNIDMAKFLWDYSVSIHSPINIHAEDDDFWFMAFQRGDLEKAKWIWDLSCEIKSPINIAACDKQSRLNIFQISYQNNRLDLAFFALEVAKKLDPPLYEKYKHIQIINDIKENNTKKLKLYFEHVKNTKNNECVICHSADDNILNLQCEINAKKYDHTYCTKCFYEWFKNKLCPKCCICSKEIDFDKILFYD